LGKEGDATRSALALLGAGALSEDDRVLVVQVNGRFAAADREGRRFGRGNDETGPGRPRIQEWLKGRKS